MKGHAMTSPQRQQQFTERLEQVQHQLFGYLFALLRNLEETQEVYQETCVALWQRFDDFEERSTFGAWACGVGRHKALDFIKAKRRRRARFSQAFDDQIASLQMAVPTNELLDRRQALDQCIEKLRPQDRELVRAVYGEGLKVREWSQQSGRPVEGVYGTLRRVREALLECIDRTLAQEAQP